MNTYTVHFMVNGENYALTPLPTNEALIAIENLEYKRLLVTQVTDTNGQAVPIRVLIGEIL